MKSALKHRAARPRFASCAAALKSSVATGALLLLAASALAAEAPMPPEAGSAPPVRDFTTYVPTARAVRIEASEAPVIDGDVSDAVWARAQVIDEFYQLEPDTGQPVS